MMLGLGIGLWSNVAAMSGGGGGGGSVTWDGANSSADWALSGGNLTATRSSSGAGAYAMLRATTAKTSGTIIVTVSNIGSGTTSIGFDVGAESVLPGINDSLGYFSNDGTIRLGNSTKATVATYTTGDVIKAVKTATDVKFYKNNVLQFTLSGSDYTTDPIVGNAYPAAGNGASTTGTVLVGDFTSW